MTNGPDLATLLAALEAAAPDVPADEVPHVLGQLETVRAALWARLTTAGRGDAPGAATAPYILAEAAALLHKSPVWLRRKAAAGRIPCARKVGRSWVFPRAPFDRFRERGVGG